MRAHPIFTVFTGSAASAMIRGLFGHFSAERFSAERKKVPLGNEPLAIGRLSTLFPRRVE